MNRERKLSQQEAKRELSGYETQYKATLEKNAEIEAACAEIEKELGEITSQLPKYAFTHCPSLAMLSCRSLNRSRHPCWLQVRLSWSLLYLAMWWCVVDIEGLAVQGG